jgi:hypothetical protein
MDASTKRASTRRRQQRLRSPDPNSSPSDSVLHASLEPFTEIVPSAFSNLEPSSPTPQNLPSHAVARTSVTPASIPKQTASCALMCLLGAALAFASKKCSGNGADLNYASVVLISEFIKFTVTLLLFVLQNECLSGRSLVVSLFHRPLLPSALPSLFFAFQNNVAHFAHQSTNPIAFQLIMNCRSFAVAILQVILYCTSISASFHPRCRLFCTSGLCPRTSCCHS